MDTELEIVKLRDRVNKQEALVLRQAHLMAETTELLGQTVQQMSVVLDAFADQKSQITMLVKAVNLLQKQEPGRPSGLILGSK